MSAPASLFIGWLAAFGAVVVWSGWIVVSRLFTQIIYIQQRDFVLLSSGLFQQTVMVMCHR